MWLLFHGFRSPLAHSTRGYSRRPRRGRTSEVFYRAFLTPSIFQHIPRTSIFLRVTDKDRAAADGFLCSYDRHSVAVQTAFHGCGGRLRMSAGFYNSPSASFCENGKTKADEDSHD